MGRLQRSTREGAIGQGQATKGRGAKNNKRDEFPALLMIFLFSVAVTTFSAFTLPQDEVPVRHREFFTDSKSAQDTDSVGQQRRTETSSRSIIDNEYHIAFSTSCSDFQDWQSYVFFYFAWKVKQPGQITRIASGCSPEKEEELKVFHAKYVAPFSDRFHLHFTPDYSLVSGRPPFKYYNKPFGVRHWMENAMGYPDNRVNDDAIFMIVDPDMYLFKPFTNDFTGMKLWKGYADNTTRVEHGKSFTLMTIVSLVTVCLVGNALYSLVSNHQVSPSLPNTASTLRGQNTTFLTWRVRTRQQSK